VLSDGEIVRLPPAEKGVTTAVTFLLSNPGALDLTGLAVSLDGPDAAEFSVIAPPPSRLAGPGGAASFTILHRPNTTGRRTVHVHVASNLPGSLNPFDFSLRLVPAPLDTAFHPPPAGDVDPPALALQADGKILRRQGNGLQRLFPSGAFDPSFFAPAVDGTVNYIAVQKDGRILLSGNFQRVNGRSRPTFARLLSDGSLDESFAPQFAFRTGSLVVQPDGKILAAGSFRPPGQPELLNLVRYHPDGSIDEAFHPNPDITVYSIALQPDGKILAGGESTVGTPAGRIARVLPDGTPELLNATFTQPVTCLALQNDGRFLAGVSNRPGPVRFLPDGSKDPSWTNPGASTSACDLVLQANGHWILAGFETSISPWLSVLRPDDTLDPDFLPGFTGGVQKVLLPGNGRLLMGGIFSDGGVFQSIRQSLYDPAVSELRRVDASTVRWMRSGAAPEVRDVTIDVKPEDAADWTRLGNAARIPGGWELSGLTLPAAGRLRAQAYAGNSAVESTLLFPSAAERWRVLHFNTAGNTGDAADDADPDHDGLTNFAEFAFGLNPVDRTSRTLPEFQFTNNTLTAAFTVPADREDLLYSAEWSATLLPGTWTPLPDTGTAPAHIFTAPAGPRVFVRYAVRTR
jgi:uncharacterized delta-60 repeat protein